MFEILLPEEGKSFVDRVGRIRCILFGVVHRGFLGAAGEGYERFMGVELPGI